MADVFGGISLPVQTLAAGEPAGDPGLLKLLAFAEAVITARCAAAWGSVAPDARWPVVKSTHALDPGNVTFKEADLPGIYAFRARGVFTNDGADLDTFSSADQVTLWWIYPRVDQFKKADRVTFAHCIGKALGPALQQGRSTHWADEGDTDVKAATYAEDADAIKLSVPTSTSPQVYSGAALNGILGGSILAPRRGIQLKAAAATGAYNAASPVVWTYLDWRGATATLNTQPTANGGTTIAPTTDEAQQIVSIAVPAQMSAAGAFEFGVQARAGRGSSLVARMNLLTCPRLRTWGLRTITIPEFSGGRQVGAQYFDAVELTIELREQFRLDPAQYYPLTAVSGSRGVTVDQLRSDETTFQRFQLPDSGID